MANPEHLAELLAGVDSWNRWRSRNSEIIPDLADAQLADAQLSKANLSTANLAGANLRRAALVGAKLGGAILTGATVTEAKLRSADLSNSTLASAMFDESDMTDVDLCGVDATRASFQASTLRNAMVADAIFSSTDLTSADFSHADLSSTDLSFANLTETDFTGTRFIFSDFQYCNFGNTNLKGATGLESCSHHGPSYLDYQTLVRSGSLPLGFLRGCGLADTFIGYLPSLLKQAIQFYSCFISYSTVDQSFAERLHADLQDKSVRCWFAPHNVKGGRKLHHQIDEAIRVYDRLLLILSEASMGSEWVRTEISQARKRELREGRRKLFPVRLVAFEELREWECFDADTGKDSAREIREYFIPDFTNWKDHDAYQQAFERLLKDLKPETAPEE